MNHYGVYVSEDEPITGVTYANRPEWLWDETYDAIDLVLEDHQKECEQCQNDEYCEIVEFWDISDTTLLIGSWKKDENDLYEPDKSGEYAAILRTDSNIVQVVWSRTIKQDCNLCSPCYPGQANLDSIGTFQAYDLPKDIWGSYYDQYHN